MFRICILRKQLAAVVESRVQIVPFLEGDYMEYRKLIAELLDRASEKQLERLYHFIKSYLN